MEFVGVRLAQPDGCRKRCSRAARAFIARCAFAQYYFQNRPLIVTGAFDLRPARTLWNFDYLCFRCGESEVEVQFGRGSDANSEINQPMLKHTMRFADYVDVVERSGTANDFYMAANNTLHNRAALTSKD